MALPSVLPIVAAAAVIIIVASFFIYNRVPMKENPSGSSQAPPTFITYSDIKSDNVQSENVPKRRKKKSCPICHDSFEDLEDENTAAFMNTKCGHVICGNCIYGILHSHCTRGDTVNPRCPLCRTHFTTEDLKKLVW